MRREGKGREEKGREGKGRKEKERKGKHLAYRVEDIYATCQRLMDSGVTINRPPRDGHMAFVRSPDNISVEESTLASINIFNSSK